LFLRIVLLVFVVLSPARSGARRHVSVGISRRAEGIGLANQPGQLGERIAHLAVRLERITVARMVGGGVGSVLISLGHMMSASSGKKPLRVVFKS
jgi:hypothetical protein